MCDSVELRACLERGLGQALFGKRERQGASRRSVALFIDG